MQYSFVSQETWPAAEASGWEPKPRRGCYLWFCLIQYFVSIFLSGIYDQTHTSNHGKSFLYSFNYYEDNHCKSFLYFLSRCRPWQTKQTKRAQATSSENCVFQISPLLAKIDPWLKLATFFLTRLLLFLEILESNVYVTDPYTTFGIELDQFLESSKLKFYFQQNILQYIFFCLKVSCFPGSNGK